MAEFINDVEVVAIEAQNRGKKNVSLDVATGS
jgi:hypothetical protein